MGFWFFMLVVDLLIPLAMVAVGLWMYRRPPRKRNGFVGYRTARSRRSQQAWDFAQRHFGKTWSLWGLVLAALSPIPLAFFYGAPVQTVSLLGGAVCCVQVVVMLTAMLPTEAALKRRFGA